ncbi:MAG: hypothetical protein Q7S33_01315 [Nanoarchaeota archaeon]|nr:hypothetical protein [Nanoarchaeota archaeon]
MTIEEIKDLEDSYTGENIANLVKQADRLIRSENPRVFSGHIVCRKDLFEDIVDYFSKEASVNEIYSFNINFKRNPLFNIFDLYEEELRKNTNLVIIKAYGFEKNPDILTRGSYATHLYNQGLVENSSLLLKEKGIKKNLIVITNSDIENLSKEQVQKINASIAISHFNTFHWFFE